MHRLSELNADDEKVPGASVLRKVQDDERADRSCTVRHHLDRLHQRPQRAGRHADLLPPRRQRAPRDISVRNLDIRLSTWMIRLNRTPSHIEQLQALAAHITQRAASAP